MVIKLQSIGRHPILVKKNIKKPEKYEDFINTVDLHNSIIQKNKKPDPELTPFVLRLMYRRICRTE
ncbi:22016_t:CDS:1, partial [Gigaspora rosea]